MIYYIGDNLTLTVPNPVDVDFLNAYLSRDGEETWAKLNASPLATTHSKDGDQEVYQSYTYVWPIVGDESATCRVQIRNAENEDVIAQSAVFEIQERVLTSIVLFPPSVRVKFGDQRAFTAVALDQTGTALYTQPGFVFTTNSVYGSITQQGVFTAGTTEGICTVTATVGEISGSANVTVLERLPRKLVNTTHIGIALTT